MKIVLDAMGSDSRPVNDVAGAVEAARDLGVTVVLVGPEADLKRELDKHPARGLPIEIVNATQVIEMKEHPANAIREKKDSSINVGLRLLKNKEVDGFASAGNTGAVMAGALFGLGRVPGIKRPGLAAAMPLDGATVLVIDVGANTDCKPEYLEQFARMGSVYAQQVLGIPKPRVALLANGEEETKGDQLVQEAHALLKQLKEINFIGNIEGKDIVRQAADVVVCDGFVGNVMLKTAEGVAGMMKDVIAREIKAGALTAIGGLLAKPAFNRVSDKMDYAEVGGAPLLGVDGVVIIGHGRSIPKAVRNMIRAAKTAVETDVMGAIRRIGA
ncbi:MAG: phosphate acyltransferase PlsX [Chloroflexi bacterium]|nr:phosphate acyltransferase PlsX [Chloroflexota bacterium]